MLHVSHHAVESYRIFYPTADVDVVKGAVAAGLVISNPIALKMVGRRSPHKDMRGSYVLHVERTGIFVLSDVEQPQDAPLIDLVTVITFLRFYAYNQYTLAKRLYPQGAAPPTADATWVRAGVKT